MSSSVSPQLTRMRSVAEKISKEIVESGNIVGVVLVGSVSSGDIHEKSDIDLIVIHRTPQKQLPSSQFREFEGLMIEIHHNSVEHLEHTFDDEQYRNKGGAWFSANFGLQMLHDGLILQDPSGKLGLWREKALQWKWRSSEIQPLFSQSRSLLDAAENRIAEGDGFAALVLLRDALTPLSSAVMMRLGLPSYWRPKDQSLQVPLLEDQYPELVQLFYEAHGLEYVTPIWLEKSLNDLTILMRRYDWEQGLQLHVKGARGCYDKGNLAGSILCARRASYCLGIEILNQKGDNTPRCMFDAFTHLKVIDQTRQESDFHQFYTEIHQIDLWNCNSISSTREKFAGLLDDQIKIGI